MRRVLGARIEQQRASLREALIAADGVVHDGLVELASGVARRGLEPGRPIHSRRESVRSEAHFHAVGSSDIESKPSTSAPFQQTLDTPAPKRRSALGGVLFAVFGIAAAASAIMWARTQGHPTELISSVIETTTEKRVSSSRGAKLGRAWAVGREHRRAPRRAAARLEATIAPQRGGAGRGAKKEEPAKDSKKPEADLPENPYPKEVKGSPRRPRPEALPEPAEVAPPPPPLRRPLQGGEAGPVQSRRCDGRSRFGVGGPSRELLAPGRLRPAWGAPSPSLPGAGLERRRPRALLGHGRWCVCHCRIQGRAVPAFTGSSVRAPAELPHPRLSDATEEEGPPSFDATPGSSCGAPAGGPALVPSRDSATPARSDRLRRGGTERRCSCMKAA